MLITEIITINDKQFRHNYSDEEYYIERNDGIKFMDAMDVLESTWTYIETTEKIPQPNENQIIIESE